MNTKARSEQIFNTAASLIEAAGGHLAIDQIELNQRRFALDNLYWQIMEQTGCVRETAKRNVAKALRRARYGTIVKRGGLRTPAGGRPRKEAL